MTSHRQQPLQGSVVTVNPSSSSDNLLRSLKAIKYSTVSPNELVGVIIASYLLERMSIVGDDINVCM